MRYIYHILFYILLPFLLLRLWLRARKMPEYGERWRERLGYYTNQLDQCIWVHAVSVGEVIASIPIIKNLQNKYPNIPIIVTTMTPTGAACVQTQLGKSVQHVYIPYDFKGAVQRFLRAFHPCICIIMETELWPNLITQCHQQHIPICLVNARLSEKSARGYRFIKSITWQMMQQLTHISAVGFADAARFIALGASPEKITVTGNLKFDLAYPDEAIAQGKTLRAQLGEERFIWIAASTHEGEDEQILTAHAALREQVSNALLILVPRHAQRASSIANTCEKMFKTMRRTQSSPHAIEEVAVYLADTMGELLLLYSAADVAVVCGSSPFA